MKTTFRRYVPWALVGTALFIGLLIQALPVDSGTLGSVGSHASDMSNTEALGMVIFTQDILAFEMAAMILLVAIVAAITLTHRVPRPSKRQNVVSQIMTRREDRVSLISMKSEKPEEDDA